MSDLTEREQELLEALEDVVHQACWFEPPQGGGYLDSSALSSYACAMRLLAEYGRIKIDRESGRRVIGNWIEREE